jgi:hypothetical protein
MGATLLVASPASAAQSCTTESIQALAPDATTIVSAVPTATPVAHCAFSRIYGAVAKDGWSIGSSDKEAGVLSAPQSVSYGKGTVAPMAILVETVKNGSKVTATFRTGGGPDSEGRKNSHEAMRVPGRGIIALKAGSQNEQRMREQRESPANS